jgi:hypothetical protein
MVIAEYSAYDKDYELTGGPKDTKKTVHETSICILQQMTAFQYAANAGFASQQMKILGDCSSIYSLDDILSKIVDYHNSMKQIGPTKATHLQISNTMIKTQRGMATNQQVRIQQSETVTALQDLNSARCVILNIMSWNALFSQSTGNKEL